MCAPLASLRRACPPRGASALTGVRDRARMPAADAMGGSPAGRERMAMEEGLTRLMHLARDGDRAARDEVVALVYQQLKRIAAAKMRRQPNGISLQTTELVHEAFAKLFRDGSPDVNDRDHFFALAATAMQQVLVDHCRTRERGKRRADGERVPLDDLADALERSVHDVLAWEEALEALEKDDPKMAAVVRLRMFVQVTDDEVARMTDLSLRTLQRRWRVVKLRLWSHLE